MKTKQLLVLIIAVITVNIGMSQSNQTLDWAFATFDDKLPFGELVDSSDGIYTYLSSGDTYWLNNYNHGRKLAVDKWNNNIYAADISARYMDIATLLTTNYTQNVSADLYLRKSDTNGNELWTKHIGGGGIDMAFGVNSDTNGDIIFCGSFQDVVDFDPGISQFLLTSSSLSTEENGFILKLDPNGDFIYAKQLESNNSFIANDIQVDFQGDYIVTGTFRGIADFDPGVGVINENSNGGRNPFVLKLDANGNYIWHYAVVSAGDGTQAYECTLDDLGNVYVVGQYVDSIAYDGSNIRMSNGWSDGFLFKLDINGNYQWNRSNSDNGDGWLQTVDFDGDDVVITGIADGTIDVNVDGSPVILNALDLYNSYVQKVSVAGQHVWSYDLGTEDLEVLSADINSIKEIVLSGELLSSNSIFSLPTGLDTLSDGIFTAVLDSNGAPQWAEARTGGKGFDVKYDHVNNILVCGIFEATIDCDASDTASYILDAEGQGHDAFLFQLEGICQNFIPITATVCGSYVSPSGNYTWISTGVYTDTITSSLGCDSIFTVNLTVNSPSASVDVLAACFSHTWIDGVTYTSNNWTATHTLVNSVGCDSVVTLNLTIWAIDNSISILGDSLTSNNLTGTYQWIDCNSGNAVIMGQNNQSFIPTSSGSCAVQITDNGCVDTSACVNFVIMGLNERNTLSEISIYPNPTDGIFTVQLSASIKTGTITVYDVLSKEVLFQQLNTSNTTIDLSSQDKGAYFVRIQIDNESIVKKLILH